MSWDSHHSASESLAGEAEAARRAGDQRRADDLYKRAASEEEQAFSDLPADKQRTRGITAVSAVAFSYKGHDYVVAEQLAHKFLAQTRLADFAIAQLRELLQAIWNAQGAEKAGLRFVPGDVLVSVKGGEIIFGGAPLDLIIQKIEGIQAVLFRTVEMLFGRPLRKHGAPALDIQAMFRPWLFQAPAGSYQFAIRVEEPPQQDLWQQPNRPKVENITATFFRVLKASATEPEAELPAVVPNKEYREAFLNLSRNLAPSKGKDFERLEVHDAAAPHEPVASFVVETRQLLNAALRKSRPPPPVEDVVTIRGVLRALHLDKDWIEIATQGPSDHIRISGATDVLDDVIGPMVNHRVVVTAGRRREKYFYRDIELDE